MIWQTQQWWKMLLASKQAENVFNVGGIQVEKRSLGLWQYGLFVIGLDYTLPGISWNTQYVEDFLVDLCKKEKVLFIQVEPMNYSGEIAEKYFDLDMFDFGFFKKFIYEYAAVINLDQTEEKILTWMKPKWRYNIKLAQKRWIVVKKVDKTDNKNIEAYYELMKETTVRDNFNGNTLKYYTDFLHYLEDSVLLLAYKDDEVVAGGIFIFRKDVATYYYWASSSKKELRNLMGPYLLQWEAIKIWKEYGSKLYDFGWVATPWEENHPWTGVTDFKKKFTADIRKVSEGYIFVTRPIMYKILVVAKKLRGFMKKLRRK